ncbi:putative ethanolamine kinase [Micractinium conductrix]|uniref:ethanolamine kinase n=1 Tax=Micractinium conductrix TaxID=554055 RepID=A0A2P6VLI1_9CHLO|nr:putative ethanolamine kinase [Micractinium conductrix]|eukprot:PSC74962.1 putative ethanolamine kinase [Micractinium conductrix]
MALVRCLQQSLPTLLHRSGAAFSTSTSLRGLEELVVLPPKEDAVQPTTGRSWEAQDLRRKSWDDLHKLWFVLLKERTRLHAEKALYRARQERTPDPARITKVRKGMARIKHVLTERLAEHEDPAIKLQLRAFIDAMRTGSGGPAERESLEVFRASAPASTDDKPRYATVGATFAFINADQALYYMANPENNRKVVKQGPGQYYCEYDGTTLPTMVRRYIFAAKVMDESGEVLVQVFNEQAEQLLGMKADELADIRDADPKRYNEVLQGALWQDSVLRVKAQAQFIDRQRELQVMALVHARGFGPRVLATFSNGRIEEWLEGMRALQPEELAAPEMVPHIAGALRRFHNMPPQICMEGLGTPFGRIRQWLDTAERFTFHDAEKQRAFKESFDFAAFRAEVVRVEAAAARAASPHVFSHNDLLSGNVMVPVAGSATTADVAQVSIEAASLGDASGICAFEVASEPRGLTFIDFEYADWAPRGFDWGNHFCEYAGFECDYSRYPGPQAAAAFIRSYLAAGGDPADEAHVQRCVAEANVYALAAHQYWGTWSLLQARWSSIDFDYLQYALLRWGEYFKRRDEFLAGAAAAFAS